MRDFLNFWTWQHQKRNSSARLPQFVNLTTSKTKQFCETSFKTDGPVPISLPIFPFHLSKVLRLPRKSDARSYEVLHLSRKIIFPKLMLQNVTLLRKFAPGPVTVTSLLNMSLVPRLPRKMHLARSSSSAPRLLSFLKCYKTLTLCSLLTRCTIPCTCHAKRHLNVHKWSEHVVFLTCWPRHVLRAATACTFSTSLFPKVVRTRRFFSLLTWKCVSRHNGVHFFDITISKSGPNRCVLFILTCTCASRHNGVHFFIISTSKSGPNCCALFI